MVPIMGMIIGLFIGIIGGSLVIEKTFSIPGIGGAMLTAITENDHDVSMLTILFYTSISLFASLIVDLSYGIVDPRIRMGGKKQ